MLQGKVVAIAGASRGLGRHLAIALAKQGAYLSLCARNIEALAHLSEELAPHHTKVMTSRADVGHYDQVKNWLENTFDLYGKVDVLINNAGWSDYKNFLEFEPGEISELIDANLKSVMFSSHIVTPHLIAQKSGHIINIASDLSRRPLANMSAYAGAKHGVLGFSQSLLREVKAHNVKVTTVMPGIMDTYFGGGSEGSRDKSWALPPDDVAQIIIDLINQPEHVLTDEITIHPLHQDM